MAEKTLKVTATQIEESVEKTHNHSNLSTLNNITSSKISEWNDKADKEHRHNASEIDGLDNLDVNLSNYYTKTQVDNKIATEIDSINLSSYAKKTEIPNTTSDLTNDSNFATQSFVTNKIAEAQLGGGSGVDLSGYATKDELDAKANISAVPTKTSQLTNDSGFITTIPSEVITETELNSKKYATETFVTNKIAEASLSGGNVDLSGYATKDDLNNLNIPIKTSDLVNDSNFISSNDEIDADKINGKTISEPMTKQEYDAIVDKDPNTLYLVDDDTAIEGVPRYTTTDANKLLAVNSDGTALEYVDAPTGSGLTTEQENQLTIAYEHSQSTHVQNELIPITENEYNNLSSSEKADKFYAITDSVEEEYSLQLVGDVLSLLKGSVAISSIVLPATAPSANGEIVISEENISIKKGNSRNINISLASAPTNSQIVNINCDNSKITINPSQLIFNSSNYSEQQAVTISVNTSITESSSVITVSSANVSSKNISLQITGNEPITGDNITSITDGLIHSYDFNRGTGNQTTLKDLTGNCDIILNNFTFETGETQNCGWNNDGSLSTNNSSTAYASIDTTSEEYNLDNLDFTIAFKAQINGSCYILSSTSNKAATPETGVYSINYIDNRNLAIVTGGVNTPVSDNSLANKVPYGTTDVFVATYSASTRTITIRNSAEVLGETVLNEGVEVKTMKYIFSGYYQKDYRQDTNKIYKLAIYNKCLSNEEISTVILDLA